MRFLLKRSILIAYFCVVLIGLLLLTTEYSFTSNILNIVAFAIIVVYPIAIFFSSGIRVWLKISISILVSLFLVLAFWNLPVALAFSKETKHTIQTWRIGTKQVVLEKRQGWAGPPYLQYQLRDFRIFGLIVKTVAIGYPSSAAEDECKVRLMVENSPTRTVYEFDRCDEKLTLIRSSGR